MGGKWTDDIGGVKGKAQPVSVGSERAGSLPQSGSDSDTFMRPEPHNRTSYNG